MLERLNYFIKDKKSFAFETTLSGLAYLKFIQLAKKSGLCIEGKKEIFKFGIFNKITQIRILPRSRKI